MVEKTKRILSTIKKGIDNRKEKIVQKSLKLLHQLDAKHGSCSLKSNLGYDLLRLSLEKKLPNISQLLIKYGVEINRTIARKNSNTPLHLAIKNNDLNIVNLLLNNGANPKIRNSQGKTPLYLAVELDRQDIAEMLLKRDVPENVDARSNKSPVLLAASNGNEYLFNLLLSKGCTLNLKQFDEDSPTILQVAVEHRYIEAIEKIITSYINKEIIPGPGNEKLLTVAVMNADPKIVELLLKAKFPVDLNNAKNSKFVCAALHKKHYSIVNQLLEVGLDLDDYWSVLNIACKRNHIETVEAVIDKIEDSDYKVYLGNDSSLLFHLIHNIHSIIKEVAKNGEVVLQHHINIFNRWVEIMKFLVRKGINVNYLLKRRTIIFSYTLKYLSALQYLANHTSSHKSLSLKPIANLLISAGICTGKMTDNIQPLDYAIWKENLEIVEVLLLHICLNTNGLVRGSSLYYASTNKTPIIIEILMICGGNINTKDIAGNTLLHIAAASKRVKVIEWLLEHNVQVNAKNLGGLTPLHLAIPYENSYIEGDSDIQCIDTLMKYKADIEARDLIESMTPLHCAAKKCFRTSAIQKLLEYEANLNSVNKTGLTPLLIAASFNKVNIVKFFIKSGANISDRNKYGETYLHLLARRCDVSTYEILEDNVDINVLTYKSKTMLDYVVDMIPLTEFHFRYHENAKILIRFMLKLHNFDVFICKENLQGIEKYLETFGQLETKKSDIVIFKESCEKEAMLLKSTKIGNTTITLYKLIKKSTHLLAQYLLNRRAIKETKFTQYYKKYPLYFDVITKSLKPGFERKNILVKILDKDTIGSIRTMFQSIADNCIDDIFSYLDNKELEALAVSARVETETNTICTTSTSMITRSRAKKKLKLEK